MKITKNLLKTLFSNCEAELIDFLHYWQSEKGNEGFCYNTYRQWEGKFNSYSDSTIYRAVKNLKELGILQVCRLKARSWDQTNHYRLNIKTLMDAIEAKILEVLDNSKKGIEYLIKKGLDFTNLNWNNKQLSSKLKEQFEYFLFGSLDKFRLVVQGEARIGLELLSEKVREKFGERLEEFAKHKRMRWISNGLKELLVKLRLKVENNTVIVVNTEDSEKPTEKTIDNKEEEKEERKVSDRELVDYLVKDYSQRFPRQSKEESTKIARKLIKNPRKRKEAEKDYLMALEDLEKQKIREQQAIKDREERAKEMATTPLINPDAVKDRIANLLDSTSNKFNDFTMPKFPSYIEAKADEYNKKQEEALSNNLRQKGK